MPHPGGRPPKYSLQYRADLLARFQEFIDREDCPFIVSFAVDAKIPSTTLYDFEEFSTEIKRAREKCERFFVTKLVDAKGNPVPTMFLLKAIHGYRDSTVIVGDKDHPISVVHITDPDQAEAVLGAKIKRQKTQNQKRR